MSINLNQHEHAVSERLAQVSLGNQDGLESSTWKRYVYSDIDGDAGDTRILSLLPGSFHDEIRIQIRNISLLEKPLGNTDTEYEALSYVWGSTDDCVKITVVDGESSYFLEITRNLAGALPYLRDVETPKILWIDAVCINQDISRREVSR